MLVDRTKGTIRHLRFSDIVQVLPAHHLLVLNETRVFPARLMTRGPRRTEVLLVRDLGEDRWQALVKPGKRARPGNRLVFQPGQLEAVVLEMSNSPIRVLQFEYDGDFWEWIDRFGQTPLPPYIRRKDDTDPAEDLHRYQTVFARNRGSVAAPTAGLHFTRGLLEQIQHCFLTLHVGYGTFQPVRADRVEDHNMDPEYYELEPKSARQITDCIHQEKTLVAVGTTTTRALEHISSKHGRIVSDKGWTDLFIYPGFRFTAVQALVTNFHLPGSTLLLLVSAFAGRELIEESYRKAIEMKYRFYSYGDAMLII